MDALRLLGADALRTEPGACSSTGLIIGRRQPKTRRYFRQF
jgi:hypothetical protein